jgi:methylaspartate ammonia-lyase
MIKTRHVLTAASLLFNFLFLVFIVSALTGKSSSLAFYSMDRAGTPSLAAAAVASVPLEYGSVVFNAVEISLSKGASASLQFSGVVGGRQANWIVSAVYDRGLIAVSPNGFGVTITALEAGETVMQALTDEGFRDVAVVRITDRSLK